MGVPCEFFGGPLAGQVHAMPYPPQPVYRVPSYPRVPYASVDVDRLLTEALETEEYELGPGRGDNPYSYTWINPAKTLRAEVARLRDEVSNLSDEREEYKDDAVKWRALVGAVGPLLDEA